MKVQVLGPLSAEVNGGSIVPSAGKPRQILSLFALYPGRVMPVPTLMEELWGTEPPQSALTTLQTYILQLRRHVGAALGGEGRGSAKEVLATRHGGYLMQIPGESVDVHQYERLA
ncbi:winged helix-turn-helix domain-containing protein, partial [Streptomyces sp. NPDC058473]